MAGRTPKQGRMVCTWRMYKADGSPLPHSQCPMAIALKENRPIRGVEAIAERPDGTRVPFIPYPTPLHNANGKLIGAINMLVDITERKKAESQPKGLMDELNHRVKNTLATVQSLVRQTARQPGTTEDFPRELRKALDGARACSRSADGTALARGAFVELVHDVLVPLTGLLDSACSFRDLEWTSMRSPSWSLR